MLLIHARKHSPRRIAQQPLVLPLNCSFHSCMLVRNDYDDKHGVKKGGYDSRAANINAFSSEGRWRDFYYS